MAAVDDWIDDGSNAFCITDGLARLLVNEDTYRELGLEGKKKGEHSHEIVIDLRKKLSERVAWCLDSNRRYFSISQGDRRSFRR